MLDAQAVLSTTTVNKSTNTVNPGKSLCFFQNVLLNNSMTLTNKFLKTTLWEFFHAALDLDCHI